MRTTDTDALKEVGPGEVAERVIAVKFEYRLSVDTRENGYSLETLLASGGGAAELRGHRHHVVDGGLELKGLGRRKGQRVGVAGEQPELHGDGLPAASGTVTVDTAAAAAHGRCRQPDRGSLQFSIIAGTDAGAGSTAGWRGRPHGVVARPPRSPDGQSDTVGAGGPFLPEGD